MVKNQKGGKGAKAMARRHESSDRLSSRLRLPTCEFELLACVTKMFGNGMCQVTTYNNLNLLCHIRNKFRGRSKFGNFIRTGSIILIGLRDWENPFKNCDTLEIYSDIEIEQLKHIPDIDLSLLFKIITSFSTIEHSTSTSTDLFEISHLYSTSSILSNTIHTDTDTDTILLHDTTLSIDDI